MVMAPCFLLLSFPGVCSGLVLALCSNNIWSVENIPENCSALFLLHQTVGAGATDGQIPCQQQACQAYRALCSLLQHRGLVSPVPDEQEHEQEVLC